MKLRLRINLRIHRRYGHKPAHSRMTLRRARSPSTLRTIAAHNEWNRITSAHRGTDDNWSIQVRMLNEALQEAASKFGGDARRLGAAPTLVWISI